MDPLLCAGSLLQCGLITKTPLGLLSPTPILWFRFLFSHCTDSPSYILTPLFTIWSPPPDRSFERTRPWPVLSTQYSQLRDLRLSILNIWGNEQVDITFQMLLSPWEEAEGWGRGARGFCQGEIRKDHSIEISECEPAASLTDLSQGTF